VNGSFSECNLSHRVHNALCGADRALAKSFASMTVITANRTRTARERWQRLSIGYRGGVTSGSNLLQSKTGWIRPQMSMDERAFYTEKEETRKIKLVCPSCRGEFEAPVRWKVCRKRRELPRGAGEEDRRKFAKATSYMVRLDDLVACYKCRKRFELTGQSTVLINDALGDPNVDPENFGNR
jgi:hypothetical protein